MKMTAQVMQICAVVSPQGYLRNKRALIAVVTPYMLDSLKSIPQKSLCVFQRNSARLATTN